MKTTLRLKRVHWGDSFLLNSDGKSAIPEINGSVIYEVTITRTDEEMPEGKEHYINPYVHEIFQPFKQNYVLDKINGWYVWNWDGNKEAPTLTPSYLIDQLPNYRIHLYFTKGKIDLLKDSTVELIV